VPTFSYMVPATDTAAEYEPRVVRRRPPPLEVLTTERGDPEREEVPAGMALDWSNPAEVRALVRLLTADLEELLCSLLEPPAK
jgi:hypothetical protein